MFPIARSGQGPFKFWHNMGTCRDAGTLKSGERVIVCVMRFSSSALGKQSVRRRNNYSLTCSARVVYTLHQHCLGVVKEIRTHLSTEESHPLDAVCIDGRHFALHRHRCCPLRCCAGAVEI